MTDDLRDQLAQAIRPAIDWLAYTSTANDIEDAAYNAADALLARFAIAGPLPEASADPIYTHGTAARWEDTGECGPVVYLSSEGQIESLGSGYWSTRKGDDPRPFAAALIAAWHKAQEQHHE